MSAKEAFFVDAACSVLSIAAWTLPRACSFGGITAASIRRYGLSSAGVAMSSSCVACGVDEAWGRGSRISMRPPSYRTSSGMDTGSASARRLRELTIHEIFQVHIRVVRIRYGRRLKSFGHQRLEHELPAKRLHVNYLM